MYFFSNSFCTYVTNSKKFIENLSYRKRCYIHYKRGGVGERSRSSLRTVGNAYDVNATGFPPDPRHLQFAGVELYTWVLGCIRRRSAQNEGGGPYMLALGRTVWCWAVHTGVWLETKVLGSTRWCWVRDVGPGRTHWRSAQNIGVGSYMLVLGCKGRHFLRGT
jgi:hypothetical protein